MINHNEYKICCSITFKELRNFIKSFVTKNDFSLLFKQYSIKNNNGEEIAKFEFDPFFKCHSEDYSSEEWDELIHSYPYEEAIFLDSLKTNVLFICDENKHELFVEWLKEHPQFVRQYTYKNVEVFC